jgi:hypothetical protein
MMADDSAQPYRLIFMPDVLRRLRAMGEHAASQELRQGLAAILRTVTDRLTNDPVRWGDPFRRLRASGNLMCSRTYSNLHFTYAVDERKRLVIVNSVRPLSQSPYAEPAEGQD